MSKSNKVLIYVEGKSEILFFKGYLKQYIKEKYNINLDCQQGDIPSFKRKVKDFYGEYKEIFILRDLKTQKKDYIDYYCITNMKKDFTICKDKKFIGDIGRSYKFIVVCNEVESWLLTQWKETDNRSEKHIQELYKKLNCNDKIKCMQKYTQQLKQGKINFNIDKNKSFKYFINELVKCK